MATPATLAPSRPVPRPSVPIRAVAYLLMAWCVGFALVNAWHLVRGLDVREELADHAVMLTIMSVLVLLIKLLGAAVALAAVRPRRQGSWWLAAATWGAASLLVLYSIGNLVLAIGMTTGLIAPSAAWTATGGITPWSAAYVLFFIVGAALFTALALSVQRRHAPRWTALAAGIVGAPIVLAGVLVGAPALITLAGLGPS